MPIPYSVKCDACHNELEVADRKFDADGDLFLIIIPCETCLEDSLQEGKNSD